MITSKALFHARQVFLRAARCLKYLNERTAENDKNLETREYLSWRYYLLALTLMRIDYIYFCFFIQAVSNVDDTFQTCNLSLEV